LPSQLKANKAGKRPRAGGPMFRPISAEPAATAPSASCRWRSGGRWSLGAPARGEGVRAGMTGKKRAAGTPTGAVVKN